ncbi:hypothetical protein ACFLSP_03015 [Bacteroidota bacterium]
MRRLFVISGLLALGMIFWAALGYLMNLPSFPVVLWLCFTSILVFIGTGFIKNHVEHRRFQEFLEEQRRDKQVQQKLENERIAPGDKTGRAKVKTYFKERNVGVNWTGASVHGAVPHRKKGRSFLSKNR